MTRKFWGMLMLASLLVTVGAAYFWFDKMAKTEQAMMIPEPVQHMRAPQEPAVKSDLPEKATEEIETETPTATAQEVEPTRNVLFRFPRASAKSVYIVGDFNDWHREPMRKKNKGWQITIPLRTGTYKYMFVVDEKRIKDPSNKNSADGKSLLNVKPVPSKQ